MLRFNVKDCEVTVCTGFFALITLMLILCDMPLAVSSLFCSLFHEFGHIASMLIFGEKLKSISFSAFGIRIDKLNAIALSYKQEIAVSLAGIFANLLLSLISFFLYVTFDFSFAEKVAAVSLAVGGFNLIPIDRLDGSRALYFFLMSRLPENKVDAVIISISIICILLLLTSSIVMIKFGYANFSLIAVTVYLGFLLISDIARFET